MSAPIDAPKEPSIRLEMRRRIGRYMITGGLLGWGVIACLAAGTLAGQGTTFATLWFLVADILLFVVFAFLVKGYRLESRHNPNFDPQQLARAGPKAGDAVPSMVGTTGKGIAGNKSGAV